MTEEKDTDVRYSMDTGILDISKYENKEKIIYSVWKVYQEYKLFENDEELMQLLCQYFFMDYQKLTELCRKDCRISNSALGPICINRKFFIFNDVSDDFLNPEICQGFMKLLFLKDTIEQMKACGGEKESITLFNNAVQWITLINGDIGVYLSKKRGYFDEEHVMHTDWIRSLNYAIRTLGNSVIPIWNEKQSENLLRLYFRDIEGVFKQLAVILIICILGTIPVLSDVQHEIINTVLFPLIDVFRESEFLDLSINTKPINVSVSTSERSKSDNTTRVEISYCYKNGDMYTIRFDTAHKGMEKFHFNLQSFGNDNQIYPFYEMDERLEQKDYIKHADNSMYYIKEKSLKEKIQSKKTGKKWPLYDQQHYNFDYSDNDIETVLQLFCTLISPFASKRDLSEINLEDIYRSARIAEQVELFMVLQNETFGIVDKDILTFLGEKNSTWKKLNEYWELLLTCNDADECVSLILDIVEE